MTWHVVSIMLSPEHEAMLGPLNNADVSLPGLMRALRRKLHSLEHTIETWDHHFRELQRSGGMARLQALLDEDAARRQHDASNADHANDGVGMHENPDTGTAKEKRTYSATEVLAGQREERQRAQSLYEAIQVGLHELEDEFPDLRADHP
jgi:hypothetical protein